MLRRTLRYLLDTQLGRAIRIYVNHDTGVPPELNQLSSYSVAGAEVLQKLFTLAQNLSARSIPGDFVECGVLNGGSAAAIACALRATGRRMWLYDSFQGMPPTKEIDGAYAAQFAGTYVGSEERVKEAMCIARFPEESYIIRKGWFQDTFQNPLPEVVSFLHIDCDWYDSVSLSLQTFYDHVAEGGVVAIDDFGHFEGCRQAFYDFVQQRNLNPLLERYGHSGAFWIKGRLHNRDAVGK